MIYDLALNSTVATIAAACWGFKAPADRSVPIYELHIDLVTGTASSYGFGLAGNTPTQTGAVEVDPRGTATDTTNKATCAVAWSVAPTVPAKFIRRKALPATVGATVIWTFPGGLNVDAGAEFVLWNITANSASVNVTVVSG